MTAMPFNCNVCQSHVSKIYSSVSTQSLTSLCEIIDTKTEVFICDNCGHLMSHRLKDDAVFYSEDYKILLTDEEEDQIYKLENGKIIYRTEHQVNTIQQLVPLPFKAKILDYGCAKASTYKKLSELRPDLDLHLFDVSNMYIDYWKKFIPNSNYSTWEIPKNWNNTFDLVTSFFSLEHIWNLEECMANVTSLIKEEGWFYGIVPNTFNNYADFIVVDHVNHFSDSSLVALLDKNGFQNISITDHHHAGAFVFKAQKISKASSISTSSKIRESSLLISSFWEQINSKIKSSNDDKFAIYGSGFYGTYIASVLDSLDNLVCFLDSSPFQQQKRLFNKPILDPKNVPTEVSTIFVGLNPVNARKIINNLDSIDKKSFKFVYLD